MLCGDQLVSDCALFVCCVKMAQFNKIDICTVQNGMETVKFNGCNYLCRSVNQPVVKSVSEREYDSAIQMIF